MEIKTYGAYRWGEFVELSQRRVGQMPLGSYSAVSQERGLDGSVTRTCETYQEAQELARYGWRQGAEAVRDADALFAGVDNGAGWDMEVAGFIPCVPAFLTGEPECMFNRTEQTEPRKQVRLVFPAGYPWFIKSDAMLEYGKALAALARSLEAAGVGVSLVALDAPEDKSETAYVTAIIVKDYGEPLDLDRVAFAGHSDFSRRIVWAVREQRQEMVDAGVGSYGYGKTIGIPRLDCARAVLGEDADTIVTLQDPTTLFGYGKRSGVRPAAEILAAFRERVTEVTGQIQN